MQQKNSEKHEEIHNKYIRGLGCSEMDVTGEGEEMEILSTAKNQLGLECKHVNQL